MTTKRDADRSSSDTSTYRPAFLRVSVRRFAATSLVLILAHASALRAAEISPVDESRPSDVKATGNWMRRGDKICYEYANGYGERFVNCDAVPKSAPPAAAIGAAEETIGKIKEVPLPPVVQVPLQAAGAAATGALGGLTAASEYHNLSEAQREWALTPEHYREFKALTRGDPTPEQLQAFYAKLSPEEQARAQIVRETQAEQSYPKSYDPDTLKKMTEPVLRDAIEEVCGENADASVCKKIRDQYEKTKADNEKGQRVDYEEPGEVETVEPHLELQDGDSFDLPADVLLDSEIPDVPPLEDGAEFELRPGEFDGPSDRPTTEESDTLDLGPRAEFPEDGELPAEDAQAVVIGEGRVEESGVQVPEASLTFPGEDTPGTWGSPEIAAPVAVIDPPPAPPRPPAVVAAPAPPVRRPPPPPVPDESEPQRRGPGLFKQTTIAILEGAAAYYKAKAEAKGVLPAFMGGTPAGPVAAAPLPGANGASAGTAVDPCMEQAQRYYQCWLACPDSPPQSLYCGDACSKLLGDCSPPTPPTGGGGRTWVDAR